MKEYRILPNDNKNTNDINRDRLLLWIEALESGSYVQDNVSGKLKTDHGYCCLGVLCDVSGIGGWLTDAYEETCYHVDDSSGYVHHLPPEQIWAWLGNDIGPGFVLVEHGDKCYGLAGMNDDVKLSFTEIAKVLRTYFDLPRP